jgi:hypothetical protein
MVGLASSDLLPGQFALLTISPSIPALDGEVNLEMSELAGADPPAQEMRSPTIGQDGGATAQKNVGLAQKNLKHRLRPRNNG